MNRVESNILVAQVPAAEWDRRIAELPDRTVFHSAGWLRAVAEAYGFRLVLMMAVEDGRTVAAWPCVEKRKGPFRVLGSPLPGTSTPYLGPLFAEGVDVERLLYVLWREKRLRGCSFFACRTQDHRVSVDLAPLGFERSRPFETYLIDLTQREDQLWSNLKPECRNRIRKAEKSGLTVSIDDDPKCLEDFWPMAVSVFAKTGIRPTFSQRFLELIWAELHACGKLCVLTAWFQGQRVGVLVLPCDQRCMYYWAGGSDGNHLQLGPNNVLHWTAILEARRRGLRTYDLISTKGGPGRFKKTFGPTALCVATHWEHSRNHLVRLLKSTYEKWMRKRRRVEAISAGGLHGGVRVKDK